MTAFFMNEATFDLPDEAGFVDRTLTHLVIPSPSGGHVVLLVERRPFPAGKSLREVAAEHGAGASRDLRGYKVLLERESDGDSDAARIPTIDVGARWRTEDGAPLYARRIHLAVGSTWIMIGCYAPIADRERCDATADDVLASIQLRE